ncbi:MAG: glycosyltransferase family 4 protein [Acidiferrobacteraceae bacterium]
MDLSFDVNRVPPYSVLILISTHVVGGPGKGIIQMVPELKRDRLVDPELMTFRKAGCGESLFMASCRDHGLEVSTLSQLFNYDPRPLVPLLRRMRRRRTIIQTHGYKENMFGLLVKLATGSPWVAFMHGTTDENLKVRMYHHLDRKIVRFADRIVTVSRELAMRSIPERHRRKVRVVHNAVEQRAHEVNRLAVIGWRRRHGLTRYPVIVCAGRLSPEKGHRVLLNAAHGLVRSGIEFHLLIAGDGPERTGLERFTARLGLEGHVQFLGQRSDMDLVYAASDILVLPSFKEGMPNVILEAMAAGLAIVATRVGGIPEMVRHEKEALLVPPRDVNALGKALAQLLRSPGQAQTLGRAARQSLFPRFSVAERVHRIHRVYQELAEEAGWLNYL